MSAPRLCVATPCGGAFYSGKIISEDAGGRRDGEEGKSFGAGLVQGAREWSLEKKSRYGSRRHYFVVFFFDDVSSPLMVVFT